MSGSGGVEIITLRDVYDALMRLSGAVEAARVGNEQIATTSRDHEGRLRAAEAEVAPMKGTAVMVTDHEARMRELERWARGLPVALVVSLASLILAAVAVWGH